MLERIAKNGARLAAALLIVAAAAAPVRNDPGLAEFREGSRAERASSESSVAESARGRDAATNSPRTEAQHWSFRKLAATPLPPVRDAERVRTAVDQFVQARLENAGLTFSDDASRLAIVRRSYFDLLGLPPSPEQVDEFLLDSRPNAYERLLDRLLASPHFGERWGRHWLDVVGYTDTVGFDIDAALIIQSEGKWRYRDYVIRAFNGDMPFDRFVTEQLAGDELVDWQHAPTFNEEIRRLLVATGFLRTAQDYTHEPESNIPLNHFAVLHDTIEIVGSSLLGLTLNCARCHDHKFDPVPQLDYYRLMALFTPAYNPTDWRAVTPYKAGIQDRSLADVSPAERAAIDQHNAALDGQIAELNKQIAALQSPYEERLRSKKLESIPEPIRLDTRNAIETPAEKRNEIQKYLASKFEAVLKVGADEILASFDEPDKETHARLNREIAGLNGQRRSYGKIQALFDVGSPPATHRLLRGNHETPGPEVEPGFLSILCGDGDDAPAGMPTNNPATSGRRAAFARWLTRPDSAPASLLARVMVNRLWQHLMGEGLVPTPDNFGAGGEAPTHPELLEYLSTQLIENGWQIKPIIKLIMTSTTYRQASQSPIDGSEDRAAESKANGHAATHDPQSVDPDNRLLWRQRLRRLESEVIRDSLLAASGKLDCQMGGPPVLLEARPDGMVVVAEKSLPTPTSKWRRSVYLLARHQYHLSMLTVFDQPVLATNCTRRIASAVPLQSLTMLNDAALSEHAEHLANRVLDAAGSTVNEQVDRAFRIVLTRSPNPAELDSCLKFLERQTELYRAEKLADQEARHEAMIHLAQTLLNASEFLYLP